jgi:predicted adenine nucleotide alpha hydrolase (AANH) superfamily ATPase
MGYTPTLFFGNSNIYPQEENQLRYSELLKVACHYNLPVIREKYNHIKWLKKIKGLESEKENGKRCDLCFEYNLQEAFEEAKKRDIEYFTTTLTVSPHKNSLRIFKIGSDHREFVPIDFKKNGGFQRSTQLSKELNLYRQTYCGCEFSLRDSSKKE